MQEYWDDAWANSYQEYDCDVQAVMDGLDVDRDGPRKPLIPPKHIREALVQAEHSRARVGSYSHNPGIYSKSTR